IDAIVQIAVDPGHPSSDLARANLVGLFTRPRTSAAVRGELKNAVQHSTEAFCAGGDPNSKFTLVFALMSLDAPGNPEGHVNASMQNVANQFLGQRMDGLLPPDVDPGDL